MSCPRFTAICFKPIKIHWYRWRKKSPLSIHKLVEASKGTSQTKKSALNPDFSISKFIEAHSPIEDELEQVSKLITQYSGNEPMPLPYKIFLNQVSFLELELRKHAIIEDYVLVPMAIELEKKFN